MKKSYTDNTYDYNIAYKLNQYKKKYFNIDEQVIKQYFPSDFTIPAILDIFGKLFSIKIKRCIDQIPKWHKDVILYSVYDKNLILGYIYLDLYPRDGKYTHAATFDLQSSYKNGIRIIPVTAIVCNFSRPLLSFGQVVTFCHELGHALHNVLSRVKYQSLAGTYTEIDFVEMPSQLFENWCWNKKFLQSISNHYKTGEKLPYKYINQMIKNKNYKIDLHYLKQILYIEYDLNVHSKKNITEEYLHKYWFKLAKDLLPYKSSENTYPMCRFDHLIGYSSAYYSYLWSIIYSYNIFSVFEKRGIFNKKIGMRLRKEILEKGGTLKGTVMLKNFFKSEPDAVMHQQLQQILQPML